MSARTYAPSICAEHMPRACATGICTNGRTNERNEDGGYDTNKSSLTDTCACVQDFCNLDERATTTPTEEKTA